MSTLHQKIKGLSSAFCVALLILLLPTAGGAKSIKIGVMGPMKFMYGQFHWMGATLAAEEINAGGGVNIGGVKHKIELVKGETNEFASIPDAVSTAERLATVNRVDFFTGGARSEAVLAMQEVMADHKIIWICDNVGSPELNLRVSKDYNRYKYWFRIALRLSAIGKASMSIVDVVANSVREQLGVKKPKVALLMEKVGWADGVIKACHAFFPKMGLEIVGVWRPSVFARDVTSELSAIKSAQAHIIYQSFTGPVGSVVSKQWGDLKIPAALVGNNFEAQTNKHWKITEGKCNYEALIQLYAPVSITPKTIPFWNNFVKRFDKFPAQPAATYDSVYLIKEAVERAGTLKTDAVIRELEEINYCGTIGQIQFSPKPKEPGKVYLAHDAIWGPEHVPVLGVQWRDAIYQCIWPDGRPALGNKMWKGVRYKGTMDYKLPPWMLAYWKNKK